ncbi:MAG: hypothetical protein NWF05_09095 [Candidatus Bathyarchaeota archaeon]|nr:hypothetical protein [Candidatus Bathyarchaeota archaeon]
MKLKALTIVLLVLMGTSLLFTASLPVHAQSEVYITNVTSNGTSVSYVTVDQNVTLTGTISTKNGQFLIRYADVEVGSGTATGYNVVANVTVPEYYGGSLGFTLVDVTTGEEYSTPLSLSINFVIEPVVPASPQQLKEGDSVDLKVSVTGGAVNYTYGADILVTTPLGDVNYTKTVTLTSNSKGTARTTVSFPDSSFSPSGSSTLYAGTYLVYFNGTGNQTNLAESSFEVGFTGLTEYHRGDTVNVNALGYQPGQPTSVAINYDNAVYDYINVTASSQGAVTTSWVVPSDAPVGTYEIAITPQTTPSKIVADVQKVGVLGYAVSFNPLNLADEHVPQILVEATDQGTGTDYNATSDAKGVAVINLEIGNYAVKAYWNDVIVGEATISITGAGSYNINCQLTDLKIKVQDKNGVQIPFVTLNLTYQYVTSGGATQTGSKVGQTDISGVYSFNSTLPGINYAVAASKYGEVFNAGNGTINSLPAQSSSQYVILCPDETLTLTTLDYSHNVLSNARVILIEQASGIFYSATTDGNGNAQLQVTFGQYRVEVYTSDNVLLNDTIINVLSDTQSSIHCIFYNLPVSVQVVDYFGNGINNVNVDLSRLTGTWSATTQGDGTATFSNVIGGNMDITAYLSGNPNSYIAKNLQVDSSTTVKLTMDKYVVFAGALVDTSLLATILIILLALALFICIEVILQRKGFKLFRKN